MGRHTQAAPTTGTRTANNPFSCSWFCAFCRHMQRLLWIDAPSQTLHRRSHCRSIHTNSRLSTAVFRQPVGDVGKQGWVMGAAGGLSKTPELHSRDLENSAPSQTHSPQALPPDFHFSCRTYGVLLSFLLYSYSFPPTRRASMAGSPGANLAHGNVEAPQGRFESAAPRQRPEALESRNSSSFPPTPPPAG